ncbi:hypothetical protein [Meiothermus ruber]|uniref:hypothetical protein n=1 Tax=Meiothermus ruber TaxID=277 RepID=UPI00034B81E4|nr:hypothetical protein [Meiothermus ruber]GAO74218.1 putative uncharacterized protein [Meiothermus ruber H328]
MRWIPVLLTLVLLLVSGPALAEQPQVPPPSGTAQQQNLLQTVFDISRWLNSISRDIARLERGISALALALVMLGFVYGIVQGILGGGLEAIKGAFVRLAVAGLMLSLWTSGFVGNTLDAAMTAARERGTDSVAATLSDAGDSLDALAMRVVPFMGAVGAVKVMTAKTAENAAKNATTRSVASGTSAGSSKVLQYLNWATLLLIPLMLFFFILIVVASFTVEVGVALFPLAAALLVFPKGAAADWFGKWVAAMMGALLIVVLLPVGFKAAVEIGINRPVNQVNAYVDQAVDRLEAVKEKSEDALEQAKQSQKCLIVDPFCALEAKFDAVRTDLSLALQALQTVITAWLLGIILLLAGMAAAAYILFNVERVAMSFVGGFVATGVRQMLGTSSLGGRIYAGRAGGGGGAGTERTVVLPGERALPAGGSPGALPAGGGSLPRPAAYEMQPYSSSIQRYGDDVIEGEWRPVRELPNPSPRGLPPASSDS